MPFTFKLSKRLALWTSEPSLPVVITPCQGIPGLHGLLAVATVQHPSEQGLKCSGRASLRSGAERLRLKNM